MGLINSRAGVTRVTLEERKRRDPDFALEDGVSTYCFAVLLCVLKYYLYCRVRQGGSPAG